MKNYINITILIIFFGILGCKEAKKEKQDFVLSEFKSQVEKEGLKIDSVDATGLIYITKGDLVIKVSLDNVRRNYERDGDTSHISNLVQLLTTNPTEISDNWKEVQDAIYISLFPNDYDFKDFIHTKVTNECSKVYIYSREDKFIWITKDNLKKWGITEKELDIQATTNADKLLKDAKIIFDTIENHKLGRIEVEHETLKAALLFAPTLREKISKDCGFPFYAVIPVRDFCYIFSENDFQFFSEKLGKTVIDEYKKSGYPITTEILKFTEKGVQVVGKYPIE